MKRKPMALVGAVVAVALVFASSALAFDRHFTVLAKQKSFHEVGQNAFVLKDKLRDPNNRSSKVGRDRFKCREKHRNKVKCHGLFRLNGKIGGKGHIRVKGDLQGGDNHLVVLGGTRQFNGVAGKATILPSTKPGISRRYHFDLVR